MKILIIIIFSIYIFASVPIAAQSPLAVQAESKLKGKVMDFTEAVIPNAQIFIQNEHDTYKIKSNEKGRFEIDLPPGRYLIRAEIPGFVKFARAPVEVRSGQTQIINIIAEFASGAYFYYNGPDAREEIEKLNRERAGLSPNYDSVTISPGSEGALDMLIKYLKKNEENDSIIYDGAVVSYDKWLLFATQVILQRGSNRLTAKGKVFLDDSNNRRWAKEVQIDFAASDPILKLVD